MAISGAQHNALKEASKKFLDTTLDFSYPQIEQVMESVFGTDRSSAEAVAWGNYWQSLCNYHETLLEGSLNLQRLPPELPVFIHQQSEAMNIDYKTPGQTKTNASQELSNGILTATQVDRDTERAERKKNGNKPPKQQKPAGSNFDKLTAELVIERQEKNSNGELKPIYYCLGCDRAARNNARARCLPHAQKCPKLEREWPRAWQDACDALQNQSGEKVATGEAEPPKLRSKKRKVEDEAHERALVKAFERKDAAASTTSQSRLDDAWGESTITAKRQSQIDYFLLRFIVCCAVAFSILDNGLFIDFITCLCPGYAVPDRSSFVTQHLASEAENASRVLTTILTSLNHLTISFDGWSSQGSDEIYTVHITTPSDRMSYMVTGIIMTGLSTSGGNLFERLKKIIINYAAVRFSMVVSDTTGNVKKCRSLICNDFPWILNCPDPCHQLNLMAKDIMVGSKKHPKIQPFSEPMKIISGIVTYFSHSGYGKYHLKQELMKLGNGMRGIERAGATRFSTFALQAQSVDRCFDAISNCMKAEVLKFDTKATKALIPYIQHGPQQLNFRMELYTINLMMTPIACGLATLEGQNTTCSDVFFVFVGIAIGLTRTFSQADRNLWAHRSETFAIFNRRFAIFMNECTPGLFLLSYLLDPIYYEDGALRLQLPSSPSLLNKETASPLVQEMIRSARLMLRAEQLRTQSGGVEEAGILVKQLIAYMYRQPPFHVPPTNMLQRLDWWKGLGNDSGSCVLAQIGIKLFSVSPSEMCDERTASKLSAMSTAKRNNLSAENLVRCAQLQQYWRYGYSQDGQRRFCHTTRLSLPPLDSTANQPLKTAAPTLSDLLNSEPEQPLDESTLFRLDPYGVQELEKDEEAEDDVEINDSLPPLVSRVSGLERLDIDFYVDLSAPKLVARYVGSAVPVPGDIRMPDLEVLRSTSRKPWNETDAKWDVDSDW